MTVFITKKKTWNIYFTRWGAGDSETIRKHNYHFLYWHKLRLYLWFPHLICARDLGFEFRLGQNFQTTYSITSTVVPTQVILCTSEIGVSCPSSKYYVQFRAILDQARLKWVAGMIPSECSVTPPVPTVYLSGR